MAGRFSNPVPQFLSDNVTALAGGKLYFYVSGTTTPQDTYSDSGLTTPNSNPVILDSAGRIPEIYAAYDKTFRVVLKTSADVTVWTKDNVQFADIQELVTLANRLQAQIDSIETVITNGNPISNPTTESIVAGVTSVTLTNSFLPHVAVGIDGRVSGTVSAGTMTSGTLSGLGSTSRQAKMAGVTGDSSSVVEWRFRVSSAEARRFANETVSISAVMRQESGVTATATVALYKANAADNFSAVTLVGSTTSSVVSSTNTALTYAGLSAGDVSNGIELVIKCQPGASFSTKDFYLTDIKLEVGATATAFSAPSFVEVENESRAVGLGVYRDTGTANAASVSTRHAINLYDGVAVTVYRPAGNSAAMTLNVDNTGDIGVTYKDGVAVSSGDTLSGGTYTFRYSSTAAKWILENPSFNGGNLALVSDTAKSLSGTSVDFTGIPVWAKRVTVSFSGMSTNGTSVKMVQIGDSGGIENSGYLSSTCFANNATGAVSVANYTDGFALTGVNAADVQHGSVVLTKLGGNTWTCSGVIGFSSGGALGTVAGSKTLSATLDRVRLTTQGGTDTFDDGTANIMYE